MPRPHWRIKIPFMHAAIVSAFVGSYAFDLPSAFGQSTPIACQPYVHGELRETLPTFFCLKKEDANAFVQLLEDRRLKRISDKQAKARMSTFQATKECYFVATQHTSVRTVHQGQEPGKICDSFGLGSTKWPSLVEAQLAGDRSTIWVLTNAIVPPVEK